MSTNPEAMLFLDTNILIRCLTQDNPDQGQRAYAILQQVQDGTLHVTTSEAVITEVVHILSSKALHIGGSDGAGENRDNSQFRPRFRYDSWHHSAGAVTR